MIHAAIACNLDKDILEAALPLFQSGKIDAIEWSFDALYQVETIPTWFQDLLLTYAAEKRLIGHGVFFSLFSGRWSEDQSQWIEHLNACANRYKFDHITEHFGFMTGADFHKGAPLSIPFNKTTLLIGQDRLKRIQYAGQCAVGLENLAFAYTLDEVMRHGEFLEALVAPVNGFIILDLHNLYCQLENFNLNFETLIRYYPLDRVREIHISGGSWDAPMEFPNIKIRRDTHDESVPDTVFELLEKTIPLCPNLKYVVLEQLGNSLKTESERALFRADFIRMKKQVANYNKRKINTPISNIFLPDKIVLPDPIPIVDELLYHQQRLLSEILVNSPDYQTAALSLQQSGLANTDWNTESWQPELLNTALKIAQKWN